MSILALSFASAAMAQGVVLSPSDAGRFRAGWRMFQGRWVRPAGTFEFRDLVSARLEGEHLVVAIASDTTWRPKLISGRQMVAELAPSRALWAMLYTRSSLIVPPELRGETLSMAEDQPAAADGPPRLVSITIAPGGVILRGQARHEGKRTTIEYRSTRAGLQPRLTIVMEDQRGVDIAGESLIDLLNRQPAVVREFLAPLLKELSGANLLRPRAGDIYRVFTEISPTDAEVKRVVNILPDLDSRDRAVRDAASDKLQAIGASAVLVAMRTDIGRLSPEQAARLEQFISANSLGAIDPAALRGDLAFLREAQIDPDSRVRAAADRQIQSLAD